MTLQDQNITRKRSRHRRVIFAKRILKSFYIGLINTINHDGVEHSGYMAFLSLLAFFPFLVFFVAVGGFLGNLDIGAKFVGIVLRSLPQDLTEALRPRILEIISGPPQGLLTLAILGTIWTASGAVEGLRTALNRAYRVTTPPSYIWRRLLSIMQFIIITVLVLVAVFFLVAAPVILEHLIQRFNFISYIDPVWNYVRYIGSIAVLFLAVASIYYTLPNVRQNMLGVVPGAVLVVILWLLSGMLLSKYLQTFHQVNLVYGSLGGIIASLLFFYISAFILIYGAEVNYLIEKALGNKFVMKDKRKKPPLALHKVIAHEQKHKGERS